MAQIDGLGHMLEILRRRISSSTRRQDGTSQSRTSSNTAASASAIPKQSIGALREKVRERLHSLNLSEGQRRDNAVRIFLESVILWEFGDDIATTHEFGEIVANISQELISHPTLSVNLNNLIDDLLKK